MNQEDAFIAIGEIQELDRQIEFLEKQINFVKDVRGLKRNIIIDYMDTNNITDFSTTNFKIKLKPKGTVRRFNGAKLKESYPDIYETFRIECETPQSLIMRYKK